MRQYQLAGVNIGGKPDENRINAKRGENRQKGIFKQGSRAKRSPRPTRFCHQRQDSVTFFSVIEKYPTSIVNVWSCMMRDITANNNEDACE